MRSILLSRLEERHMSDEIRVGPVVALVALVVFLAGGGIAGCMAVSPVYGVYKARKAGEAELAQANYSKQVAVQTAKAKAESAQYEAQAKIIDAGGVAKANQIIGDSLKNNEAYLRYLYITDLANTKNQVVYIPTEGALPILEAGKRPALPQEDEEGKQ